MSTVSNDVPSVKRPRPRTLPVLRQREDDPLQQPRFFSEIVEHLARLAQRHVAKIGPLIPTLVGASRSDLKNTRFVVGKHGDLLYQIFGSAKTTTLTIPELRASIAAQRLVKFGLDDRPSHGIWKRRLLVEMQFLPRRDLPVVKTATVDWCDKALLQRHYEGFVFLLQVRNYGNRIIEPAPYSHRFAAMWCGTDCGKAGASIEQLFKLGLLTSVALVKPLSGFKFNLLLTKEEANEYLLTHRPRLGRCSRNNKGIYTLDKYRS